MTQNNDPISEALGITLFDNDFKSNGKIVLRKEDIEDYEYGRQNLIDLIEKGKDVFTEFAEVAKSAQEPRHYEVLTNLLNSLLEAQEKLLNLKKKNQEIENNNTQEPGNVTNNLFVGSTSDLQAMISEANKKKNQPE